MPSFGVPEEFSSDRGPHFVTEIIQEISKFLQIKWDLHTPWRPQSSGKVERMNQTIKQQTRKLCQETQIKWIEVLPLALLRIRITPRTKEKISPFEILYGRLYVTNLKGCPGFSWDRVNFHRKLGGGTGRTADLN